MQQVFHGRNCNWTTSNQKEDDFQSEMQKAGQHGIVALSSPQPLHHSTEELAALRLILSAKRPDKSERARQPPHLNPAPGFKGLRALCMQKSRVLF